jgi:hypothetical protein
LSPRVLPMSLVIQESVPVPEEVMPGTTRGIFDKRM